MNLEYFKKKFDTLYKQHDTRRIDIAAETGIRESKITKLRKLDDPTQPTVDDLIAISDYYNVTVDELLCPQDKKDNQKNKTFDSLGNILEALFEIDNCIGVNIKNIKYGNVSIPSIHFNNSKINDFLTEWKRIKEAAEDYGLEDIIEKPWKKDKIESYEEYTKERHFEMDEFEYAQHLAKLLITDIQYNSYTSLTDKEMEYIKAYINTPAYSNDIRNKVIEILSTLNVSK